MDERRLEEIESKILFQELALQELNDVLYQQRQQIDRLELLLRRLGERLETEPQPVDPDAVEEKPPHY